MPHAFEHLPSHATVIGLPELTTSILYISPTIPFIQTANV
jgi:hypothetical protein